MHNSQLQAGCQRDADRSALLRGAMDREDGPDQSRLLTQTREAVMSRMRGLRVETDAIVGDSQSQVRRRRETHAARS